MHVPNREKAEVHMRKVTEYLLSRTHPDGAGKARFFLAHGFDPGRPQQLIDALLLHVREHEFTAETRTIFGVKYVVDGAMATPDGRAPTVRSIWIIEEGHDAPRFVSAFPGPRLL